MYPIKRMYLYTQSPRTQEKLPANTFLMSTPSLLLYLDVGCSRRTHLSWGDVLIYLLGMFYFTSD